MPTRKANAIKAKNNAELLSYIINVTPELRGEIDLPVQGESIAPIGKLIVNNQRYKNAFLNTVNLIGATIIKNNGWVNPWNFTRKGELRFGQQVRELIADLVNVYDYNENFANKTRFLETEVPNIFNYIHEINFQKFYETTTSDAQIAMAFDSEDGLFNLIDNTIGMLYESLEYDRFLVDKYMLQRRILDGTTTVVYIPDFDTLDTRKKVSKIKAVANRMTFRSPNYNPAGVNRATPFESQMTMLNSEFESEMSTEVLATSYFRNDAEMKNRLVLIDSYSETDEERLKMVLGSAYVPFTNTEKEQLQNVVANIMADDFYMDYYYAIDAGAETKQTDFYNPTTLERNVFLHYWGIFSTSPFANIATVSRIAPTVTDVTVNPAAATTAPGQTVQLSATVATTGFANKAVTWTVTRATGEQEGGGKVTVDANGKVTIPSDYAVSSTDTITIQATSVFDKTQYGEAIITVA